MGRVYQRGPGNWWIKWREGGRTRTAHGYATRELAEQVLAKTVADIASGRAGLAPDPKGLPTLGDLAKTWLERRERTHRAWRDDRCRWDVHLSRYFGGCKPNEIDAASIRRFVEAKLSDGLAAATVGHCVRLLSTFFADVVEQGYALANPVSSLPRSTRRLYRSTQDPRCTPFLEKLSDVRRVFLTLAEPYNVAFAVGALAGLRTGEVLGLDWRDVDLTNRRIHIRQQVQEGRLGPLKDSESRVTPILNSLSPILAGWKLKTGGDGQIFRPACLERGGRPGRAPTFVRPQTLHRHLGKALKACGLPPLTWYQATRHTFASQWVLGGGSIETLSKAMGHASVVTTERYSHLRPDLFREQTFNVVVVDLSQPASDVLSRGTGCG
jgi:integrase